MVNKRIAVTILFDTEAKADCISTTQANRLGYTEQSLDAHARTASGEHLRAPMLTSPVTLRIGQHYRADIPMRSVAFPLSMSFSACPGVNGIASTSTALRV